MIHPHDSRPPVSRATSADIALRPTRVRWRVMALLLVVSALTFLDRLNLSIAGKFIQDEFHLGTQTMGWILSAFVLGYALFQVPGGWLADRYGPRAVITGAILWWSIFSAATAIAPRLPLARWFGLAWSFAIIRFLIGLGEGTTYPNANKIVSAWMGAAQRGIGNSMFLAGIGVGGVAAPILIAWVMNYWGWQASFYVCGCIGIVIALVWHFYVRDQPSEHPRVNMAELAQIHALDERSTIPVTGVPISLAHWRQVFSSASVWGLVLSYFFLGYASYLYYTWFYLYLVQVRHLTVVQGGFWGSTPFLAMALLTPVGGLSSDAAVKRMGRRRGRQRVVWFGLVSATALLWLGSHTAGNTLAILSLAIAAGFIGFASTGWWAVCNDLTRNFSGSLSGLMNMGGNLGGWTSPVLTAYIATHFGWTRAFDFAGLLTLAAGGLWFLVNADQQLEESDPAIPPHPGPSLGNKKHRTSRRPRKRPS
jgi:ACS family glucarate transporter-like MFS transporter